MKMTTICQLTFEDLQKYAQEAATRAIEAYKQQFEGEQEMTVEQAAKFKGVSKQTIRNWINNKANPLNHEPKNGKCYTIKRRDLEAYRIR